MNDSKGIKKKNIAILGSTGSIGTQALEVISNHSDIFELDTVTAHSNADLLIEQAKRYKPSTVIITDEGKYSLVKDALKDEPVKVFSGIDSVCQQMKSESIDVVLTAMVGYPGLKPTLEAIRNKKTIALANKETLVVAGDLVTTLAKENGVSIFPVDSEHSAIFQCLLGEWHNPVEKIILTASGGPFRGKDISFLKNVTKEHALKHPNWSMGAKITIDSATLMNKGLEVIEAKWLFGVTENQIEVIVHPQSIIHSMVQFMDGSIKAQMGLPDMRLPIQFALGYPQRLKSDFPRFDFSKYPSLTFEPADIKTFRNLALAFEALHLGGNMPCVINAANEVAVNAFLYDKINFLRMPEIVEQCMEKISFIKQPDYDDYVQTDKETRIIATELISS